MFVAHETTLWLNLLKVHLVKHHIYACFVGPYLQKFMDLFLFTVNNNLSHKNHQKSSHPTKQGGLNMPVSRGGGDLLREFKDSTYTPGSTNIAGWKMDPDWRCSSYWKWGYSSQLCQFTRGYTVWFYQLMIINVNVWSSYYPCWVDGFSRWFWGY